jgi:hypothetical protein
MRNGTVTSPGEKTVARSGKDHATITIRRPTSLPYPDRNNNGLGIKRQPVHAPLSIYTYLLSDAGALAHLAA